jgi:hypothetical protein
MSLSRDVVLLITHSGDFFTIDRVIEALLKKGVQPFQCPINCQFWQIKNRSSTGI